MQEGSLSRGAEATAADKGAAAAAAACVPQQVRTLFRKCKRQDPLLQPWEDDSLVIKVQDMPKGCELAGLSRAACRMPHARGRNVLKHVTGCLTACSIVGGRVLPCAARSCTARLPP